MSEQEQTPHYWAEVRDERDALRTEVERLRVLVDGSVGWRCAQEQRIRAEKAEEALMGLRRAGNDLWNEIAGSAATARRRSRSARLVRIDSPDDHLQTRLDAWRDAALRDTAPTRCRPGVPSLLAQARATLERSLSEVVRLTERAEEGKP